MSDGYITLKEVALRLGISYAGLAQRALNGSFPAKKFGRQWEVKESDLDAWIVGQHGKYKRLKLK